MAKVAVDGRVFDVELAVFDKDGTLVDFHQLWGGRIQRWVEGLCRQVGGSQELRQALYRALGYDGQTGRVIPESPLAVASTAKIYVVAATVLYQHGWSWVEAEQQVEASATLGMNAPPTPDLIRPLGDVAALFGRLKAAGVHIAIATSDDRVPTQATLPLLGIEEYVSLLACGDDNIPNKPAPDALFSFGRRLGIEADRMMVVGDTETDMMFGRNAGVGCLVGVVGDAGDPKVLAAYADVLIGSLGELQVLDERARDEH